MLNGVGTQHLYYMKSNVIHNLHTHIALSLHKLVKLHAILEYHPLAGYICYIVSQELGKMAM